MEVVIVLALIALIAAYFKNVKSLVYGIAVIEIFLRIMSFLKSNLGIKSVANFISKYFPNSIPEIIGKYSSGIIYTILIWLFVICMAWFLVYIVIYLFKRK